MKRPNLLYRLIRGEWQDWWPKGGPLVLLRWVGDPLIAPRKGVSSWDAHRQYWAHRTEALNEERRLRQASRR